MDELAVIIWITGLSGAGKSTIGQIVYDIWKAQGPATVLVDGDEVRKILRAENRAQDYTMAARRVVAQKIHDLCAWLDGQGINVVCCTISQFDDLQQQNRATFSSYCEVYVAVPMEMLYQRDIKNLYKPARAGDIKNVVGVDIPFTPPNNPDLIIENKADREDLKPLAQKILATAGIC